MKTGSGSSLAAGSVSSGLGVFSTQATVGGFSCVSSAEIRAIGLNVHVQVPISGSVFRLVVTKLEGKSPVPLWFSPFHQFGSLHG